MTEDEFRQKMIAIRTAEAEYPSLSGAQERIAELEAEIERLCKTLRLIDECRGNCECGECMCCWAHEALEGK